MNRSKLDSYKLKVAKLLLMETLMGSMAITGCSSNKVSNVVSETTIDSSDELNNFKLIPYKEVTLPAGYQLIPNAVEVNESTKSTIQVTSAINSINKGYHFINSNYGSLNIIGDVKDIDVTVNKDNTITYKASEGYIIYEPYCVKIVNDKMVDLKCVKDFNPIIDNNKVLKKDKGNN